MSKPPILIADEPTGNLDPDLSVEVMNIFRRFNEVGVTVLIASHDLYLLERFPVRRIRLEGGRIQENDAPPMRPLDPEKFVAERSATP